MVTLSMIEDWAALETLKEWRYSMEQQGDMQKIQHIDEEIDSILDRRYPRTQ